MRKQASLKDLENLAKDENAKIKHGFCNEISNNT